MSKKFILFIYTLFFLLALLIPFKASLADEYITERWRSGPDSEYEVQRIGDQITFTTVKIRSSAPQRIIGTVALKGVITGTTFNGIALVFTDECPPNLDRRVPASGTVSDDGNSITVNFDAMLYDPKMCQDSGKTAPKTTTFTRISSSNLTPTSNNAQVVGKVEVSNPQKLLPQVLVGLVLMVIVGIVVFFLKKKGKKTKFSKKKK